MSSIKEEVEVFRISPIKEKYYETAEFTRKEGIWPKERYYTTNPPKYVGKFIKHLRFGDRDGATHIDIFDDNGKEIEVYYSYEGRTSFREVLPKSLPTEIKKELLAKTENNRVKSLATLAKYALSSSDIVLAREYGIMPSPK
jgi:hypothetical protein